MSEIIEEEIRDKCIKEIKEAYENIAYLTHPSYLIRVILISRDGMPIVDFIPENEAPTDLEEMVRSSDGDQLAAFISSIFTQSSNLSQQTMGLNITNHDLVTEKGVTIVLQGVVGLNGNIVYLGFWVDPKYGHEIIFRKGASKLRARIESIL